MQAPALTLAAGLAVRDAVAEQIGAEPDLRWPNDLLLNGKKVCGILTEMYAEPDRIRYVVVGMGLNVNHSKMPAEIANIAISLRIDTGKVQSRLELTGRLLRQFENYYNQLVSEGPGRLWRDSWLFPATPGAANQRDNGPPDIHMHDRRT